MKRARSPGFTLLELLIAIALTAIVIGAVAGALVTTLEAQKHVEDKLSTEKTGYGILSLVRRDLEGCYVYATGSPIAFKGDRSSENGPADRLAFVTTSEAAPDPQTGLRPKFQRVGYRCKSDSNGSMSLYRRADAYTGGDPIGEGTFVQVASGIKGFQLSDLDPKDKTWKDDAWDQTDRVPLAVKVSIDLVTDPTVQQNSSVMDSNAPHYETIVGLGTVLTIAADPQPSPGAAQPLPGK